MNHLKMFALLLMILSNSGAQSQEPVVKWSEIRDNAWIAKDQVWGPVKFSAIKVHLGYYQLHLIDIRDYREQNIVEIQKFNLDRDYSDNILDSGIGVIFKTWSNQKEIVAVAPAGFSRSLRSAQQLGFLRVSGKTRSEYDEKEGLTAILCLDSPAEEGKGYDYQVPVFYRTSVPWQLEKAEGCRDGVQVGPRVLEDPETSKDRRGIQPSEQNLMPAARVVFALDDRIKSYPPDAPNYKLKENAADAYIIVTQNDVHLWDIQEMLLSPEFYGADSRPQWAVNMVGGGPSGLVVAGQDPNDPIVVGNSSGTIGSALVITAR